VGLLGLNGAGKTTALRILACDLLPSSGSVVVDGFDVVDDPHAVRSRIGYLPDRPPLYAEMTVHEYLVFAAQLRGLSKKDAIARAKSTAAATQLDRVEYDPISSLSHGYQQRVGIAQAIVHDPALVILDEPITGLDPVQIVEMRELLLSLRGKHTILLSSHILSEISQTCDQLFIIREGRIVDSGTERELSSRLLEGTRLEVTVEGPCDKARKALSGVAGVASVEDRPPTEPGDDVHAFFIGADRDVRAELVRALVGEGLGVLRLARSEHELESIFSRLVRGPTVLGQEPDGRGQDPRGNGATAQGVNP
jgi:ABC-2 type transport system ATP-binding protein